MRAQRAKLSRGNDVAKAMDYMLKRWTVFRRFLDDGRICLSNNAAERGVRGIALGRKSLLFCRSDRGGERATIMYSLIVTAKMNDVDPQAWLADVLARIAEHPAQRLELLPCNWRRHRGVIKQLEPKLNGMRSSPEVYENPAVEPRPRTSPKVVWAGVAQQADLTNPTERHLERGQLECRCSEQLKSLSQP
jgi:hypothetical protein